MKTPGSCFSLALFLLSVAAVSCFGQTKAEIRRIGRNQTTTTEPTTTSRVETTTASPRTSPGFSNSKTNRRNDSSRRKKWSYSELEDIFTHQIKFHEMARRSCEEGQFYNLELQTCSDCTRYCPSKQDITNCGIECRGFYNNRELQQENENAAKSNITLTKITAVTGGLCLLTLIALIVAVIWIISLKRRLQAIEKMVLGKVPTGDENDAGSAASLLRNGRQETTDDDPADQDGS